MLALLTVTMLGAGVDYCLFILWRYKEERQNGRNRYIAIREATIHAGESVVSSGSTVMIGFGSLLLSSFPLMTQLGLGPMVGIAFSLLAALTIIPILLHLLGDKIFFPRNFDKEYEKRKTELQTAVKQKKENKTTTRTKGKISILNRFDGQFEIHGQL
jgi:RND superfamily putative drug exporter